MAAMSETVVRRARASDLEALTEIYNHYVIHTPVTFDVEPYTPETRRPWLEQFADSGRYQLFVVEERAAVLGYAGTVRFRPKAAYETSVETTIYLRHDCRGRGLGTLLYGHLLEAMRGVDARRALGGITLPNEASVALHKSFGFAPVGTFSEVGRKFGRYWDVLWLEKRLP
jgi:phosphinothricin acetyltransferase